MSKRPGHKTIWQLDKEREKDCPSFGTRRECGGPTAVKAGCLAGPCGKVAQRIAEKKIPKPPKVPKPVKVAKKATPRKLMSQDREVYLQHMARDNAIRLQGTQEGGWVWHTEACCMQVWRPIDWGCMHVVTQDGDCTYCKGVGCTACDARIVS